MMDGYEVCSYAKILYVVFARSLDMPSKQALFGSPCIGRRERNNCLRACNAGVPKIHSNIGFSNKISNQTRPPYLIYCHLLQFTILN